MQKRKLWKGSRFLVMAVLTFIVGGAGTAYAESSSSSHYQITESQFGAGSSLNSCSDQYCAQASIGDGNSAAVSSSASFGSTSDDSAPVIEVIVEPGDSDLGKLTTQRTATKITTIRIRTFLSGGYTLQIVGDPPKFEGHTLTALTTPTASAQGTEQFGMNLAANTTPSVGVAPAQVPDDGTVFGAATDDYKTANLFKYVSGDVVARSLKDSGRTDYTLSTIINISNATPAGHYSGDFSAIVMPAY